MPYEVTKIDELLCCFLIIKQDPEHLAYGDNENPSAYMLSGCWHGHFEGASIYNTVVGSMLKSMKADGLVVLCKRSTKIHKRWRLTTNGLERATRAKVMLDLEV